MLKKRTDCKSHSLYEAGIPESEGTTMGLIPLPVAKVYRNGLVESVHRGSIAVVDTHGDLLYED